MSYYLLSASLYLIYTIKLISLKWNDFLVDYFQEKFVSHKLDFCQYLNFGHIYNSLRMVLAFSSFLEGKGYFWKWFEW